MSFTLKLEQDKNIQGPQKVYFFLLGLLFLAAPFYYQPNLGGEGLYLPHNSTLWLVALTIITSASWLIFKSNRITLPHYWLGLALLPLGALVTGYIADNNNPVEWLIRISVIVGGYLFLIALSQFRLSSRMAELGLYLIVVMGVISAALGLIQIQSSYNYGFKFLPISPKNIPYGNFQQINLQASLMATVLVVCFYLISRPSNKHNSFALKLLLITATLAASYILAMSGSRIGALGAVTSLAVLLVGRWKLYLRHNKLSFILLISAMVTGIVLGQSGITKTEAKFERAIGGMEKDIRWKVYGLSWELLSEAPVVGHGIGSFQKVFQEKRAEAQTERELSLGNAPRFSHPHNELIFWMVEGGILAIFGILIAAVVTFLQLIRLGYQRGLGYAALLIPIVLHTQVELPFYISNSHWFVLLFLLFLVHKPLNKDMPTTGMSRAAQITLPSFILAVCLYTSYQLITAQIANAGLVKYLRHGKPSMLVEPIGHFYFREYATYLATRLGMINGIKSGNQEPVMQFIFWAEKSLVRTPVVEVYRDLIIAYNSVNMIEERDQTLVKALSIYPQFEGLLKLQDSFKQEKE